MSPSQSTCTKVQSHPTAPFDPCTPASSRTCNRCRSRSNMSLPRSHGMLRCADWIRAGVSIQSVWPCRLLPASGDNPLPCPDALGLVTMMGTLLMSFHDRRAIHQPCLCNIMNERKQSEATAKPPASGDPGANLESAWLCSSRDARSSAHRLASSGLLLRAPPGLSRQNESNTISLTLDR